MRRCEKRDLTLFSIRSMMSLATVTPITAACSAKRCCCLRALFSRRCLRGVVSERPVLLMVLCMYEWDCKDYRDRQWPERSSGLS